LADKTNNTRRRRGVRGFERKLQDLPSSIYESYGMTETITHIALKKLNGKSKWIISPCWTEWNQARRERLPGDKCSSSIPESIVTNDLVRIITDSHSNGWADMTM